MTEEVMISVGNVHSSIIATGDVMTDLERNFAYEVEDAAYIRDAKIKFYMSRRPARVAKAKEWAAWDGKFSVFNYSKFGSGILGDVLMHLTDEGHTYEVLDMTEKPKYYGDLFEEHLKDPKKLYDYQQTAFDALNANEFRGVLHASTAFGKTVLACDVIDYLATKTIIIVDKKEIMAQWIDEIDNWFSFVGERIKGVSGKIWYADGQPIIMLCTSRLLQSVHEKKNPAKTTIVRNRAIKQMVREAGLLIYDEVHHAAAKQSRKVVSRISAYHRIGLTGTANMREDNADYEYLALIGGVVHYFTPTELVETGKGSAINIKCISPAYDPDWFQLVAKMRTWDAVYSAFIMDNEVRNGAILKAALDEAAIGNSVMILVDRVRHARFLAAQLGDRVAAFTHSGEENDVRKQKVADFKSGKVPVFVCTYALGGEGFDYPDLNVLILAGGRSETKIRQSLGRIMREKTDGSNATLYDFADTLNPFRDHFIDRLKVYKSEAVFKLLEYPRWVNKYV